MLYDKIKSIMDEVFQENKKYKQTLEQIKEYCTDMQKDHYWGMRMMRFANEILKIISECEATNER